MRKYGITNIAPQDFAPAVGPKGDAYYHNFLKEVFVSDGTSWIPTSYPMPGITSVYRYKGGGGGALPAVGEFNFGTVPAVGSTGVIRLNLTDLNNYAHSANFFTSFYNNDAVLIQSVVGNWCMRVVLTDSVWTTALGATYVSSVVNSIVGTPALDDICTVTFIAAGTWYTAWGVVPGGYKAQVQPNTQALTSAGGIVDMTGMSVTWTPVIGRLYKESAICHMVKDATAGDVLLRTADGASIELQRERRAAPANGDVTLNILAYETFASTASVTRKLRAQTVTGNATIQCASSLTGSMLSTFMIEDAGPA